MSKSRVSAISRLILKYGIMGGVFDISKSGNPATAYLIPRCIPVSSSRLATANHTAHNVFRKLETSYDTQDA